MFELRALPIPFEAMLDRKKTHVVIAGIGVPQPGDFLRIKETTANEEQFTGRELYARVTWIELAAGRLPNEFIFAASIKVEMSSDHHLRPLGTP